MTVTEFTVGRLTLEKAHSAVEDLITLMGKPEGCQFLLERKRDIDELISNLTDIRCDLEHGWNRED